MLCTKCYTFAIRLEAHRAPGSKPHLAFLPDPLRASRSDISSALLLSPVMLYPLGGDHHPLE